MSYFDEPFQISSMPVQEDRDFSPLPEGEYLVEIKTAEIKATKSGTGKYINVRMDVIEGKYAKRVLFSIINIKNDSDVAEKIGRSQLGEIMRSNNIGTLQDTDQLIGATMMVRVVIGEYKGEAKNEIKGYRSAGGVIQKVAASSEPTSAPVAAGKAPPWAKK
ncbi:Protein of unknown function DUF669 [uncultured Caudovirales phage]|uniref:DUF669 domain-containing protein n=1 Tax=uncultured Caudovirales phage TaxID=2100421 RepID=A0A6J7XKW7_9CAUD|nr:Protein of unknown function DUF669 [uncultured Caudovirales phage]CAB4178588.1 Protein of unknown function DUF669 [uncultured Caudovirales phage]CAB4184264.1 Protein of unknown function DUF669 [uncultured Caudovirales phage]CAB4202764.1 Protein of unknown function DUF669 [uncultured Caudovirales phage]CAB4215055.1 Protein of unknown function DUF669 [uncultured Caudovirales phage]